MALLSPQRAPPLVKNEVVYVYIPTIKSVDTKDNIYLRLDKTHMTYFIRHIYIREEFEF
jgi:hypothetical protein